MIEKKYKERHSVAINNEKVDNDKNQSFSTNSTQIFFKPLKESSSFNDSPELIGPDNATKR